MRWNRATPGVGVGVGVVVGVGVGVVVGAGVGVAVDDGNDTDHDQPARAVALRLDTVTVKVCAPAEMPLYVRGEAHGALAPSSVHVVPVASLEAVHANVASGLVVGFGGVWVSRTQTRRAAFPPARTVQ